MLVGLHISTFQMQLSISNRFPGVEYKHSARSEQATTTLKGYADPLHILTLSGTD